MNMIKMKRPEDREAPSLELIHLQEPNISRSSGSENSSNEKVKPSYVSYKKQRQNVFTSRSSRLEREALQGALHEFRGFINLFWVCIGVLVCNTILHQFRERDLLMVLSTFLCVPIVRLYADGWIKNKWIFYILQALFQLSFLVISTAWAMSREWPWPQSFAFTMHCCALLMKIHSYIANNAEWKFDSERLKQLESEHKKTDDDSISSSPAAARELQHLRSELVKKNVLFPENISFANFFHYLLVPTLVYEMEYPQTQSIRISYLLEKLIGGVGVFVAEYFVIEHYITPVLEVMHGLSVIETLFQLWIPFTLSLLLFFVMIFECICNFFAELSQFADREFYEDWWNSLSYDEMSRKWNKPVHEFLLRHVYLEAIDTLKLSKSASMLLTFVISSIFHEFVMFVVCRKFKILFFLIQLTQLPIMWVMRRPCVRGMPVLSNVMYWILFTVGLPVLTLLYTHDQYSLASNS